MRSTTMTLDAPVRETPPFPQAGRSGQPGAEIRATRPVHGFARMIVLLLISTMASIAVAQAPDPQGLNPESASHGRYVSVGFAVTGDPLIAFQDQSPAAGMSVTHCEDLTCVSRATRLLDPRGSSNGAGFFSRINVAPDGRPVIVHISLGVGGGLRVYRCEVSNCGPSMGPPDSTTALAVAGLSPASADAAIGSDNLPVISTFLQSGAIGQGLWILKCEDPACASGLTATQVEPMRGESGRLSAVAVGSDGLPVVAFQDRTSVGSNGNLAVMKCNDPACEGQNESIVALEPLGGFVDRPIDLTLNSEGHPVIAFAGPSGFLRVITCNDPACAGGDEASNEIITESAIGFAVAVALDTVGRPVIAAHGFSSTRRSLEVINCNDTLCAGDDELTTARVFPESPEVTYGRYLDLVVASSGEPFLAYTREERISSSTVVTSARTANCVSAACIDLFKDGFE